MKGEKFPRAGDLLSVLSYSRNTNITPEQYIERFEPFEDEIVERAVKCVEDYTARKRNGRYMDFDDILHSFALRLHSDRKVGERMQKLFDHILVDEGRRGRL